MRRFIIFWVAIIRCFTLMADEAVFTLGSDVGWQALDVRENVGFTKGRYGKQAVTLSSAQSGTTGVSYGDLYVSFDSNANDLYGNYTLQTQNYIQAGADKSKYGNGAALCSPHIKSAAATLIPNENAFFYGDSLLGSFSIEFWIYPEVTENGSTLLRWRTSHTENRTTIYQHIIASIIQNKIDWSLTNIWQKDGKGIDVKLTSRANIIPNKWSHHLLTYNASTGAIEYRMNGITEALDYLTDTKHEGGNVYYAVLGKKSEVVIGKDYSGYIDEVRISKMYNDLQQGNMQRTLFEKYPENGGRIESTIVDTGGNYSKALYFTADTKLENQTAVFYFARAANNRFNWTDNYPEWQPICPDAVVDGVEGRYLQLAASIYPDGSGQKTPIISSMQLTYEKDSKPLPPIRVIAEALDGAVELTWSPSIDFDVRGYVVYYGERSGEYFGARSPINVGNVTNFTVDGLQNGKLYFFAIAAYDRAGPNDAGEYSNEVWARPKSGEPCP